MSSKCGIHQKGIIMMLRYGASVSIGNADGETPLHYATFSLDFDVFLIYLPSEKPQDLLAEENDHGESLLHYAAAGSNVDILEYPLDRDFDVNATNNNGWTPLMCALAQTWNGLSPPFLQKNRSRSHLGSPLSTVSGGRILKWSRRRGGILCTVSQRILMGMILAELMLWF